MAVPSLPTPGNPRRKANGCQTFTSSLVAASPTVAPNKRRSGQLPRGANFEAATGHSTAVPGVVTPLTGSSLGRQIVRERLGPVWTRTAHPAGGISLRIDQKHIRVKLVAEQIDDGFDGSELANSATEAMQEIFLSSVVERQVEAWTVR